MKLNIYPIPCVFCPMSIVSVVYLYYLCCLSCLCWYRKQRLSNLWQWAFHLESINAMFFEWSHCYSQPRPPLVLVSYLFHKQKKISKLGWAAIWQSVCLKLIFNTRTKNIRYVQTEKPVVSCILSYTGMLQLLVCPFTSIPYSVHNKH